MNNVKQINLHNARVFTEKYNPNIILPSPADLDVIVKGNCVKVGVGEPGKGSEAFWAEVVCFESQKLLGVIVNQLRFTHIHGLEAGDIILIDKDNIFSITE